MSGYYGTDTQQRMQRKSDRLTPWVMNTPGACLTGRVMGTDDPDRLGWDIIRDHLAEDGAYSFRWIGPAGLDRIRRETHDLGVTIHGWDGYANDAVALRRSIAAPLARDLPAGMARQVVDAAAAIDLQRFFVENQIAPLSASVLTGRICQARSIVIRAPDGMIAAAGFVGMMQNRFSPLHDCAWAGLIASATQHRGQGLGLRITCELIRSALDDLGARRVMGFAAPDNLASKAMLARCGLLPADHASYVTTLSGARFTR